jgi:hypothetical protein
MKNVILATLLLLMFGCAPVRYVYVDQKDSVIRKQRVVYDDIHVPSPFFFNYNWGAPFYTPIMIQRQRPILRRNPVVIPSRPNRIQPNLNRPIPPRVPKNR